MIIRSQQDSNRTAAGSEPAGIFRIAAVQMASGPKVAANLTEARRLIETAARAGAKLVALPEYFGIMGMKDSDKVAAREKFGGGPIQDFLSQTARELKIWLVGGSVPLDCGRDDKIRNSCLVYDDAGKLAARYDKIHLFGFEMGKEVQYQRRIEIAQRQLGGWFACRAFGVSQHQPEGIAIGDDRSRAGILLLEQAFGEEALEQRGEFGGNCEQGVHCVAPWAYRSKRSAAIDISSGMPVKYQ